METKSSTPALSGVVLPRILRDRRVLLLGALILVLVLAWAFFPRPRASGVYRTARVERGDLVVSVGATGTVEPEEVIDIGAQVAGQIVEFGKDKDGKVIDYGSAVEQGMVLARIDDALYRSDVNVAEAQVTRANADLMQMKAKLFQAEQDWKRAQKLGPSDALSQSSYDAYRAGYEVAQSNVAVSAAAIVQAQAALDRAKRNLGYCTISAPVDGVVIDRRVNIGQTVVSSLNAPSLFLIAKDLKKMQIWVAVNEADIGSIRPGQPVSFTVDTFPGETFRGSVEKIRLNATMTQNVVTYTVEVGTDNSSGKLLPYLTANVRFEVSDRKNVLLVPNAALRWSPRAELVPQASRSGNALATSAASETRTPRARIWAVLDGKPSPIDVVVGGSDGAVTEVSADNLEEGAAVIIGDQDRSGAGGASATTNPFAPQMFRGGRGR